MPNNGDTSSPVITHHRTLVELMAHATGTAANNRLTCACNLADHATTIFALANAGDALTPVIMAQAVHTDDRDAARALQIGANLLDVAVRPIHRTVPAIGRHLRTMVNNGDYNIHTQAQPARNVLRRAVILLPRACEVAKEAMTRTPRRNITPQQHAIVAMYLMQAVRQFGQLVGEFNTVLSGAYLATPAYRAAGDVCHPLEGAVRRTKMTVRALARAQETFDAAAGMTTTR